MTEETFRSRAGARRNDLTKKNQGDAQRDPRECRCGAYMGCLAQPARRFVLSIGVAVRRYLEEKQEGEKSQCARQRPHESPHGFLRKHVHPCAPLSLRVPCLALRKARKHACIIVSLGCSDLQERCDPPVAECVRFLGAFREPTLRGSPRSGVRLSWSGRSESH